jgi:HK97 family phage prohead protease
MTDVDVDERAPLAEPEYRSAETLEVRFPDRTIEVIAVPYDEETVVPYRGTLVVESIAPGAFAGIERRANRIKVNRDHDVQRPVGRATAIHPTRPEGLVAELRISQGALGDETLQLAADGVLDASVCFAPFPGCEQWSPDKRTRRITKGWLSHIAMTSDPAYDGAQVLTVRHNTLDVAMAAVSPTPNLDTWRAGVLEAEYLHRWTR